MMTTPWPPRRTARRPLPPRLAAPREQVDPARIGRRVVRRRAKGMDAGAAAAALEDARFDARQASRNEDLADEVRGPAELAEWERIAELLAAAVPGTVYDPDVDDVLQAELATTPRPPPGKPSYAKPPGLRPAPTNSSNCAASAPWARPSRPKATKPYATNSPAARAGTSRRTSTAGSPTPWQPTAGTAATQPPARPPPAF
ncbi:hypothetical protein [Streptomyces goshikiensis]